jgi:phosphate uptake regulator
MKRKLIKLGPATLTASLPKDWIDRFNLKRGDEIELEEIGTKVIISTDKDKKKEIFNLDIGDKERIDSVLHDIVVSMYKAGLTDIAISNLNNKQLNLVKTIVNNCIGFEIISSEPGKIRITDLGKSDEESLTKAEEQIYWKLLYMIDQILDIKSKEDEIKSTDLEINRLSFFIQRNLKSKFSTTNESFLKYEKVVVLESLGDSLRSYKIYAKTPDKKFIAEVGSLIDFFRSGKTQLSDFIVSREKLNNIQRYAESNKKKDSASVLSSILILKDLRQIFETILALNVSNVGNDRV